MKNLKLNNILAIRRGAFKKKGYYMLLTLNSLYFKLYIINIFKDLAAYIRVKICCILACNLALLVVLIFI